MRLFLLIGLTLGMFSCEKDPKSCMEISSENVSIGQDVTFKTCSENALSYDWFFIGPVGAPENTMGSSEMEWTNSFTVAGTYTVGHVAFEKFSFLGKADTTTKTLIVN
jgi:hypothetical protein